MAIKPQPNHRLYLQALRSMSAEQRLGKALELSQVARELFLYGLNKRFTGKSAQEVKTIYLARLTKCYNRNY